MLKTNAVLGLIWLAFSSTVAFSQSPVGKNALSLNLLYYEQKRDNNAARDNGDGSTTKQNTTSKTTYLYYNISAYHFFNNFGLGLRYLNHTQSTDSTTSTRFSSEQNDFQSFLIH